MQMLKLGHDRSFPHLSSLLIVLLLFCVPGTDSIVKYTIRKYPGYWLENKGILFKRLSKRMAHLVDGIWNFKRWATFRRSMHLSCSVLNEWISYADSRVIRTEIDFARHSKLPSNVQTFRHTNRCTRALHHAVSSVTSWGLLPYEDFCSTESFHAVCFINFHNF
jgi:hypothetical protein